MNEFIAKAMNFNLKMNFNETEMRAFVAKYTNFSNMELIIKTKYNALNITKYMTINTVILIIQIDI